MNYRIDQKALSAAFFLPAEIADKHLKIATRDQLRVILYIFRNASELPSDQKISNELNMPLSDVNDCLGYWADAGLLIGEYSDKEVVQKRTKARILSDKPSREEIALMSKDDEKLPFLYSEIQTRLARPLRQAEAGTFAWLYCEEGMDISVILMLVEYAVGLNKANIRFIEKTAIEWLDAGVEDILSAEEYIIDRAKDEMCHKTLAAAFGIRDRKLNKTEKELAKLWIDQNSYSRDMLEAAYDICVDTTGAYSIKYIKGIFDSWQKKGIKTKADLLNSLKTPTVKHSKKEDDHSAIDKSLLDQLLNN